MNRKRSDDNLPKSKRLKTPSVPQASQFNPIPRTPGTSAVVHGDRDGPQDIESLTTPSFHIQNDSVFPSEMSTHPLGIQDTQCVISSTSGALSFQSSMQQGGNEVAQSREVLYREHQDTHPEDFQENYRQHGPCAEDIPPRTFVNDLSVSSLPLEGLPRSSISQGDGEAQYASLDQLEISDEGSRSRWKTVSRLEESTFLSTLGTSIHDTGRTTTEVYNNIPAQSRQIAVPFEPLVAQFPVRNSMLQSAQKVNISGNASLMNIARDNVVTNVVKCDGTHGLEEMKFFVSFSAQFDSSAQDPERICHPGTRQNVLKRMEDWIDDPTSTKRIFWLHGPAGAGKSAIAQTIAQSCGRQKVPATFFFFRSDSGRNDGNMLFTTLAYQLALSIPAIKEHITQSLHERPDLPTKGVEIQFNDLIAQPFRSLIQAASTQLSPVSIIDGVNQCQQLAPVIIIDGVDECTDEKIQQRFLKIIGNAVKDNSFPFRFLICSRPEVHIEDTLNKFKGLVLPIDLAKLNDANHDIEKYLVEQFSSIASNRDLELSWPGREVIQNIIYKSSGNFIFASVVIKVVGDEDSMPEDQLAIILNLKSPEGVSPFAALDELYLEILRRQRHQDFLKTFLALLVGRIGLLIGASDRNYGLYEDDAKLMNVSEKELHTKLRKMRSLLKFQPHIDVHHRSFLDFLNELSRSGDYHVSKQTGTRRYVELVVESIVRDVSRVIENPDYHETHHLILHFNKYLSLYPHPLHIPFQELQDVLHPLAQIQDEVLKLANSSVASDLLSCDKCTVFFIMHRLLLHLPFHRCVDAAYNESITKEKHPSAIASLRPNAMQSSPGNDLDSCLSSLLTLLQDPKLELLPGTTIINHTYPILHFGDTEVAVKLQSISDAQRLVDLLMHLIDEKHVLRQYKPDTMSKAAKLVLRVFSRIPVVPRSLFFNVKIITSKKDDFILSEIGNLCSAALTWRVLDKNYIHLEMGLRDHSLIIPFKNSLRSEKWRQVLPLDSNTVIEVVLDVARAIQYLHSMGVTCGAFDFGNVYLDLSLRPRIRIATEILTIIDPFKESKGERSLYKDIFAFGCFFHSAYFNIEIPASRVRFFEEQGQRQAIMNRPTSPKIPEYAWQLIQRCCAEDPRNRPTIEEVVREMQMWGKQPK